MKITDVTLTLFAWDDIPPTTYGAHTGRFAGSFGGDRSAYQGMEVEVHVSKLRDEIGTHIHGGAVMSFRG